MIKILPLLLSLIQLYKINCFEPKNDFCFKNEKINCTGMYDNLHLKYTEACEKVTCQAPLTYNCKDYCTLNMLDCMTLTFSQSYYNFKVPAKKCFTLKHKSSDFCLNGKNCLLITANKRVNISNTIDCLCPENKSFKCGEHCTKDSLICNSIIKLKITSAINKPKSCNNANTNYRVKKNSILYSLRF